MIWSFDESAATDAGGRLNGGNHIREREIARIELARLDLYLKLPLVPSIEGRSRNAGDGEQARTNSPLHQIAQLHRRQLVADEAELE